MNINVNFLNNSKSMANALEAYSKRRQIEKDLLKKNVTVRKYSPSYYHQKGFRKTSPKALKMSVGGFVMDQATLYLKDKYA